MSEASLPFSEQELRQIFFDQQARMEVGSLAAQRVASIHRLVAKIQSLDDNEFDAAYKVLESIIDQAHQKKQSVNDLNKKHETPEKILHAALKVSNQSPKKK